MALALRVGRRMTLLVVRPVSLARRCAGCLDDLSAMHERWTCGGCGTALHAACLPGLRRCPTLGCRRPLPERGPVASGASAGLTWSDRLVQALVFVAPLLLAALSPVIAVTGSALVVEAGRSKLLSGLPLALPLVWILSLALPFLVGQGVLAPMAHDRGLPGEHHARARASALVGFFLSGLVISVLVIKALARYLAF